MTTPSPARRRTRCGAIRRVLRAALPAALLTGAAPALAADESAFMVDTTADLARLCGVGPDNALYAAAIHMCQGYLLGVHHFHEALAAEMEEDIYCEEGVQPQPTRDSVTAAFVAWVAENPQIGETEALDGLLTWASNAFPCQQ